VWDLRHFDPNSRGFPQLVQADVEKHLHDSGVELEFSVEGDEEPIGPVVAREALMVVREAVRNALQHGQPSALRLALRYLPGKLSISVFDNGRGFAAADKDKENEKHFGLIGMRERVARVNGSLTLQSDEGKGTAVSFWVPLDALNLEVGEETSRSGRQI
jgi:two-component system sensor histidine kinase DegS